MSGNNLKMTRCHIPGKQRPCSHAGRIVMIGEMMTTATH